MANSEWRQAGVAAHTFSLFAPVNSTFRRERRMAERKPFLLRLPADLLEELNLWARDELRSVNAQMEFILREAIRQRRRQRRSTDEATDVENPDQPE